MPSVEAAPRDAESILGERIGLAWLELRRLPSSQALRDRVYGAEPEGLNLAQADALGVLVQQGRCRMAQLAERLRVDRSTATRAVTRLVARGLAERLPTTSDGRGVVVVPTEKGLELHSKIADRADALMRSILDEFDLAERGMIAELLDRLVAAVIRTIGTPEEAMPVDAVALPHQRRTRQLAHRPRLPRPSA